VGERGTAIMPFFIGADTNQIGRAVYYRTFVRTLMNQQRRPEDRKRDRVLFDVLNHIAHSADSDAATKVREARHGRNFFVSAGAKRDPDINGILDFAKKRTKQIRKLHSEAGDRQEGTKNKKQKADEILRKLKGGGGRRGHRGGGGGGPREDGRANGRTSRNSNSSGGSSGGSSGAATAVAATPTTTRGMGRGGRRGHRGGGGGGGGGGGQTVCHDNIHGQCTRGDACRYSHDRGDGGGGDRRSVRGGGHAVFKMRKKFKGR
jgi:hypothetical protein